LSKFWQPSKLAVWFFEYLLPNAKWEILKILKERLYKKN